MNKPQNMQFTIKTWLTSNINSPLRYKLSYKGFLSRRLEGLLWDRIDELMGFELGYKMECKFKKDLQ